MLQAYSTAYCDSPVQFISAGYDMLRNGAAVHSEGSSCSTNINNLKLCYGASTSGVNDARGTWKCQRSATRVCSGTYQIRYSYAVVGLIPGYPPYIPGHSCIYNTPAASAYCVVYTAKFKV